MRNAGGWAVLLAVVLVASGCAAPQDVEAYRFAGGGDPEAVSAFHYAGRASNPIDLLQVRLRQAPPFQLRLPDGTWLPAAGLTRDTLVRHGLVAEGRAHLVWQAAGSTLAWVAGRHQSLSFFLDDRDEPVQLTVSACGMRFDALLRSAEGAPSHGFPLAVQEAIDLFGRPAKVEVVPILTGFSCL